MHDPFVDATVTETRNGDLILNIKGPYDCETLVQGPTDVDNALKHIRPCEEDREAGFDAVDILSSTGTRCEVHDRYAWIRFQHEQAMEVLRE